MTDLRAANPGDWDRADKIAANCATPSNLTKITKLRWPMASARSCQICRRKFITSRTTQTDFWNRSLLIPRGLLPCSTRKMLAATNSSARCTPCRARQRGTVERTRPAQRRSVAPAHKSLHASQGRKNGEYQSERIRPGRRHHHATGLRGRRGDVSSPSCSDGWSTCILSNLPREKIWEQ